MNSNLSVIILTYNEEKNIGQALDSVVSWTDEIFILDSYSNDKTLEIAKTYECEILQHSFENYAKQRNFALDHLPIKSEWVLFLDADEWMPQDLKEEILAVIKSMPEENGFYLKRRLIWMGQWIKRGYYPTWILRLFRYGKARCEDRAVNEHLVVEGKTCYLQNDFMHEDKKGVTDWIAKHNHYATLEAKECFSNIGKGKTGQIIMRFRGTQEARKRWLRYQVWNRLPTLIRPFLYFFYRYILRGGFLDGRAGFTFHFLQGLWFPLLIDIKYLEMRRNGSFINSPRI